MHNIIKISPKVNKLNFIPIIEIYKSRSLINTLAKREFGSRHKHMSIGILWIIFQPILMAILLSIFLGHGISDNHGAYFFNVLVGWGVWQNLNRFLGDAAQTLETNIGLISKVYFRRIHVIIAKILAILFDLLLLFIPLLIALIIIDLIWDIPSIHILGFNFVYFILGVFWLLVLGTGLSAFFSVITIKFRDVGQILGLLSMIWMFSSPIWSNRVDMLPKKYIFIATYNPAYGILNFFRRGILNVKLIALHDIYLQIGVTALVFIVGLFLFNLLERHMIDRV